MIGKGMKVAVPVRVVGMMAVAAGLALCVATPLGATQDDESWRQGGFQIGGPYGVVIGGGHGLRIGGRSGVQFGGGVGARFGGDHGVQFGGGVGARFGGPDGVQFGGGAGAKFGSLQYGGESADGSLPTPPTESGDSTNGASANGDSTNGDSTNGASTNDASANGAVPAPRAETSEQPITVYYPAGAKNKLSFKLNGDEYVIAPGQTMTLRRDRRWILQYERKPSGRRVQIELGDGRFEFVQTDAGWNLRPMPVAEELPVPGAANAPPPPDEADVPRSERRRRRRR